MGHPISGGLKTLRLIAPLLNIPAVGELDFSEMNQPFLSGYVSLMYDEMNCVSQTCGSLQEPEDWNKTDSL